MDPMTLTALLGLLSAGATGAGAYFGQKGQKPGNEQIPRFNEGQNQTQDLVLNQIKDILSGQGAKGFEPIEAEEKRRFEQETLPSISNRFTQQFGPNQRQGSGFDQLQSQAGKDLGTQLAAMKANFGNNQLSSLLNFGAQSRFDTFKTPENGGVLGNAFAGLAPALGQAIPLLSGLNKSSQDSNNSNNGNFDYSKLAEALKGAQGNSNPATDIRKNFSGTDLFSPEKFQFRGAGF